MARSATVIPSSAAVAELQNRALVLETRVNSIDDRFDDQANAYSRNESLLAGLGLLLTLLILYLGWRVEKSAIQAATSVAKDDLKQSKQDTESCVAEAKKILENARQVLIDIEGHKALAVQRIDEINQLQDDVVQKNEKKR